MTRLLQAAAALTLLGLALMVWSMVQPTPMPVMLAMSVGQLFGTAAFAMFGYAVVVDQLRKQRAKAASAALDDAGPSSPASAAGSPQADGREAPP